jgi:hypothetical protein
MNLSASSSKRFIHPVLHVTHARYGFLENKPPCLVSRRLFPSKWSWAMNDEPTPGSISFSQSGQTCVLESPGFPQKMPLPLRSDHECR